MNRKLWIDGAEMSVITTTRNGEMIAVCWGQTSATARPLPTRDQIAMTIDLTDSDKEKVAKNYLTRDSADAVLDLLKGQDR